jgi:hypothetical protein
MANLEAEMILAKCLTKIGRQMGWSPLVEADMEGCRYLADANAAEERGDYAKAERLLTKSQFWLDRYNKLAGNA